MNTSGPRRRERKSVNKNTFGDRLREVRMKNNLKQSDVAEKLGCAATSLTNWESGKFQPSLEILSKLCDIYNIPPRSLLSREYSYPDLVLIALKPVSDRSYEEQVAFNFSSDILSAVEIAESGRQDAEDNRETELFLRNTSLLDRFSGMLNGGTIQKIMEEYQYSETTDADLLFAYHALTSDSKQVLLFTLSSLLSRSGNIQDFGKNTGLAVRNTIEKLDEARNRLG